MAVFLGWHGGVFVLAKAGFGEPEETLATILLWAGGLIVLGIVATRWVEGFLDRWLEHQEVMKDKETEQLRYRQLMQQSVVVDSRRQGEDKRRAALVYAIMDRAYDYYAQHGPFKEAWRPWSRRSAGQIVLAGETEPVGETLAVKAKEFLLRHEVIVREQINVQRYPDLASVQRLLYSGRGFQRGVLSDRGL
jgi:hypothetical protein